MVIKRHGTKWETRLMCSTLCRCHCTPEDKAEICSWSNGSQWQTFVGAEEQDKI